MALIILAAIFLLLLGSYFIIDAIANRPTQKDPAEKPELMEGEDFYLNVPIAYPRLEDAQFQYILVRNESGTFDLTRPSETGSFWLSYDDGNGIEKSVMYEPPILSAEGDFDYEQLYAVETGDGYSRIPLLTYLCTAIGTTYFDERIPLPTGEDEESKKERALMLEEYGLDEKTQYVAFAYLAKDEKGKYVKDENGKYVVDTHEVVIGNRAITGSGYYFMVDGRDYVYYTSTNYFEYALRGFYSFIKGTLVAPGLTSDSTYEPYLTTDFKQWVNEAHEAEGESVMAGSNVIATGSVTTPIYKGASYTPKDDEDGYEREENTSLGFDLTALRGEYDYERLSSFLTSLKVYEDYSENPKTITLLDALSDTDAGIIGFDASKTVAYKITVTSVDSFTLAGTEITTPGQKVGSASAVTISGSYEQVGGESGVFSGVRLDMSGYTVSGDIKAKLRAALVGQLSEPIAFEAKKTEATYTYTVLAVEAILTDGEDIVTEGAAVQGHTRLRLEYTLSIDGVAQGTLVRHGVFDLSDALLPSDAVASLSALSVGRLDTPITFDVTYTEQNSHAIREELVIADITAIYDSTGAPISKVAEDSYLTFRYYQTVNGVKGEMSSFSIGMAEAKESARWSVITTALLGKTRGEELDLTVFSDVRYYEAARSFIITEIDRVDFFIVSEMVTSFKFANASERDPFYGESYYENTLNNEYKLYGLNASACENVVKFLGGIDTDSTASLGISGETVSLGITNEDLKKFKYTIYFELPRGIYDKTESDGNVSDDSAESEESEDEDGEDEPSSSILDSLNDFGWYSTLGFTLYISEEQPDGTRLVGSDMYDLIAKIDGEKFYFLEYEFVDFWARRNMILVDMREIDRIEIDFNMEDVYGEFNFNLDKQYAYLVNTENGKEVVTVKPDGDTAYTTLTIDVAYASTTEESMDTALKTYLDSLGLLDEEAPYNQVKITNLYNHTLNGGENLPLVGMVDTVGITNFKMAFELLQTVRYQHSVTDEEREVALATESLMTIRLKMRDECLHRDANADGKCDLCTVSGSYGSWKHYDKDGNGECDLCGIAKENYYTYNFHRFSDRRVLVSVSMTDKDGNPTDGLVAADFYISTYAFKKIVGAYLGVVNGVEIDIEHGYID